MKKFFAVVILALAMSFALAAQDTNVGVQSHQSGNAVSFSAFNSTGGTVCVFPYVSSSYNVYGQVVDMIQLESGENVNIGAFAQQNPNDSWSVVVSAKWRAGTCA